MTTAKNRWDVERAAAWLRSHGWGEQGEAAAPTLDQAALAEAGAEAAQESAAEQDEIDIAGWPALVAPFYD